MDLHANVLMTIHVLDVTSAVLTPVCSITPANQHREEGFMVKYKRPQMQNGYLIQGRLYMTELMQSST